MQKIMKVMKKQKVSQKALCNYLGVTQAIFSQWKSGALKSYMKYLPQIAEFLGVSVDYLVNDDPVEKSFNVVPDKKIYFVPVFESVAAGYGMIPNSAPVDYRPGIFNSPEAADESMFIIVKGDSMFPKIEDGDMIQVLKVDSVDSGSIAVVIIDGEEGVVKRVVYGDDFIELQSINPMYKTRRFEGRDVLRIRVVGLVKSVVKSL